MAKKPQDIKTIDESSDSKSVKDYMTVDPKFVTPQTTISEVANLMAELGTGSLPVGNKEKLVGFITDRDIVIRGIAKELNPQNTPIEKIITDEVLYCYENNDLKEVAKNMRENEVLRLVVLDENKKFKGVITHSQLAQAAIEEDDGELYEEVTELACYDKIS
ncbi:MAG: hrp1 2 [Rickettsiaceae bacterium]|jgi:CBS domain-containing protein|nr:hrp1 2 [Rickettsiaceae bacterium]